MIFSNNEKFNDYLLKKINRISFKILKNKLYELIHLSDYSDRLRSVL